MWVFDEKLEAMGGAYQYPHQNEISAEHCRQSVSMDACQRHSACDSGMHGRSLIIAHEQCSQYTIEGAVLFCPKTGCLNRPQNENKKSLIHTIDSELIQSIDLRKGSQKRRSILSIKNRKKRSTYYNIK